MGRKAGGLRRSVEELQETGERVWDLLITPVVVFVVGVKAIGGADAQPWVITVLLLTMLLTYLAKVGGWARSVARDHSSASQVTREV